MPAEKNPELAYQIVDALREWAVEAGLNSDREIAEYLGFSPRTFEQWAQGHVPRLARRYAIAEKTGIPYEVLGIPEDDTAQLRKDLERLQREIVRVIARLRAAEAAESEPRSRKR